MLFQLVRVGWPNTAAVLALAAMPMAALATAPDQPAQPAAAAVYAAACPMPAAGLLVAAGAATLLQ